MSELINNSEERKRLLKHLILQLHNGEAPQQVRARLVEVLQKIPYGDVVQVEQELINEGLPEAEVLKLCDVHTKVLDGHIDQSGARKIPPGHPVDTFKNENQALLNVTRQLNEYLLSINNMQEMDNKSISFTIKSFFNQLMDVNKHYRRKENLLFPFLEKYNITGPPKVMWGKHDETRQLLKAALDSADVLGSSDKDEINAVIKMVFKPAAQAIIDMTMKEEEILFPMCMDSMTDYDWYEIYQQTPEIGFCLIDPKIEWSPEGITAASTSKSDDNMINLPSGSFDVNELNAILNALPIDITFVNKNDQVSYFSQGAHRIFDRNRSILKRDVKLCHPPSSVHIVEKIIHDFKTGRQSSAPFWIQMGGKFIHIEYFALRDKDGTYLGTLEVSQDLTLKRKLEGDQRLLTYEA